MQRVSTRCRLADKQHPSVPSSSRAYDEPHNEEPALGTAPSDEEYPHAFAQIARDYPAWHVWPGTVAGVLYARRPRTSPPLVVRAATTDQLRQAIEDAERERGLR